MLIPLKTISTPGLLKLMRDVAAELEVRLNTPEIERVHDVRPVRTLRVPAEDDADFVLMIAARVKSGGYVKAAERQRVAEIAQEFGEWVKRQGLPTTHNSGDWRRKIESSSAPRLKER